MVLNLEPLDIRLQYLKLRMYIRIKYSDKNTLLNRLYCVYRERMDFIENKQNKVIRLIGVNKNDKRNIRNSNKYFKSTTIYQIFDIASKYQKYISISDCEKMEYRTMSVIPKYDKILNEEIMVNTKEMKPRKKGDFLQIFTDGSCDKNPGKSTFGYYNENDNKYQVGYYEYPMNILFAELAAIELVIDTVEDGQVLLIYSDSLTSLKMLNYEYYPKDQYTKDIIDGIIEKLNKYNNDGGKIILNKIKSHVGYIGNEKLIKL